MLVVINAAKNLIGWEKPDPRLSDKDLSNVDLVKTTLAQIVKQSGKTFAARILTLVSDCPVLQWNERYINSHDENGYIDNIKPSDMNGSVIMQGVDRLKRPFVALQIRDEDGRIGVETLFQRNKIDPNFWTSGHREKFKHNSSLVHEYVTEKEFAIFQKLVKGEETSFSGFKDCKLVAVKVQLAANKVDLADRGDQKS